MPSVPPDGPSWANLMRMAIMLLLFVPRYSAAETISPARLEPNSAHRLLFWAGYRDVVALTDAQLDDWKARGVGGFICMSRALPEMGGTNRFTADPAANLELKGHELQRSIRESRIVQRAKDRGLKMYLGCHLANYYNTATPLKDWFDDEGWAKTVLPRMREFAGAARLLGFAGITFDQELYPQKGRVTTATWGWDYPGNTHSEAEVRAQARQRGRELMRAVLDGFPAAEIVVYHYQFPGTWWSVVQERRNHKPNAADPMLFIDFWDGMSSVEGYQAIRFINSLFYKATHVGRDWDAALQYEFNSFYSLLSLRLSNWHHASSRIFQSPFSWMNAGPRKSAYDAARSPEHVASQLAAFAKWGMGGEFANFCYGGLGGFDYTRYAAAMKSASVPAVVDAEPPRLTITAPDPAKIYHAKDSTVTIAGVATDNLAVRVIRWVNDRGGSGAAQMTWHVKWVNEREGFVGQMNWSVPAIALLPGVNRIELTVEDIKGLSSSHMLSVLAQ